MLAFAVANVGMRDLARAQDMPTCAPWLEKVADQLHASFEAEAAQIERWRAEAETAEPYSGPPIVLDNDPWDVASMTEAEKLEAIECLLGAENDLRPAAFGGVTRFDVSAMLAPTTANLAALFAISYIYNGRYDHALGVALRGDGASDDSGADFPFLGYRTSASAIDRAYEAYRAWFIEVRGMGLENARQAGIQPLDGTGLDWY